MAWPEVVYGLGTTGIVSYRLIPDTPAYKVELTLPFANEFAASFLLDLIDKKSLGLERVVSRAGSLTNHVQVSYRFFWLVFLSIVLSLHKDSVGIAEDVVVVVVGSLVEVGAPEFRSHPRP